MDLKLALSVLGMTARDFLADDGLSRAKSLFKAKIKQVHPDVNSSAQSGEETVSLIAAMRLIEKQSRPVRNRPLTPPKTNATMHHYRVVGRLQAVIKRLASIILVYTERLARDQSERAHHRLSAWGECDAMRRQLDHFVYYLRNEVPREELEPVRTALLGFISQLSRVLTAIRYSQLSPESTRQPEGAMVKLVMLDTILLFRSWAASCRSKPWEAADSFSTHRVSERLIKNLNRLQPACITFAWHQASSAAEEGLRRWLDLLRGLVSFEKGAPTRHRPRQTTSYRHAG